MLANIKIWEEQLAEEGRQEGEQAGLNKGLRLAVRAVLDAKFGADGLAFWAEYLEPCALAGWQEILENVQKAKSLGDLTKLKDLRYR